MKNKKGFTLVELIIVIAILAIIMLIGTAAYSSIQERMKVRADKATAGQIGKAIKIRETDVGEENGIGLYPEVIEYDSIDGIENYIAKEIKPQSMEDGNFVATAFQTQTGKKIVVGIGKKAEGETNYNINGKVYNKKDESGWAWSEDVAIDEFLKDESVSGTIGSGGTGTGGGSEEFPGEAIVENTAIVEGAYIVYEPNKTQSIVLASDSGYTSNQTFNPSETTKWVVLSNNGGQLDIISARSVGDLTLTGETGYAKAVYTLNKLCKDYINPTYATGARNPGYVKGSSMETIDTATYPITWENTYTNGNNGFPYADEYYSADKSRIMSIGPRTTYMWLASRNVSTGSSYSYFFVRYLTSGGVVYSNNLYYAYSDGSVYSDVNANGVCPIVSLKSGIKFTYGEGTVDNPYRMREELPSWAGETDFVMPVFPE